MVPSYQALTGAPWYHFLHGNVPGHEIDFIYRPDVPRGPLTEQHFSHLARLMKDIEPPASGPYAFAIGNLSRDDTQHEPGHGGVALLFGLRIHGALDHAGRNDPPFAHAIAAIDREIDPAILLESAKAFRQRVLGVTGPSGWYRDYVRCATEGPSAARRTLEAYVKSFEALPPPKPSTMGLKWTSRGANLPRRVVIVHDDDACFDVIATCAAKIAAMLYQSDLRWTSISNGREADVPNGISIRFVAQHELVPDPADKVHRIHEIPEEEAEIARQIFDARAAAPEERPAMQGWRDRYSDKHATSMGNYAAEAPRLPENDPVSTPRIDEEQVARLPSPEPVPAPTAEANAGLREDLEKTLVMEPGAAPAEAPGEPSIDCSSIDSVAPEPAAKDSPATQVGSTGDHPGDAGSRPRSSRWLFVSFGLAGSALAIVLAMAATPTTVPQEPAAPPERGVDVLVEPSLPIAASPSAETALAHQNTLTPAEKAPGSAQQAVGKPSLVKTPSSAKGMRIASGPAQGPGGQRPPGQGATEQSPARPVPDTEGKATSTPSQPSAVFGANR